MFEEVQRIRKSIFKVCGEKARVFKFNIEKYAWSVGKPVRIPTMRVQNDLDSMKSRSFLKILIIRDERTVVAGSWKIFGEVPRLCIVPQLR